MGRTFTRAQADQLLALLELGALNQARGRRQDELGFYSNSVMSILAREGLVAHVLEYEGPPGRVRPANYWFLTAAGEAEARQLVRARAHG